MIPLSEIQAKRAKATIRKAKRAAKAAGLWGKKRARKPKTISRKVQLKRLKKAGLVLWSVAVRNRDGNKCLMCPATTNLNAHHWLYRKSHSVRLALDPANGATLCAYPCHLGRVHHDGDGEFIMRLFEKMGAIVGQEKIAAMREIGKHPSPVSLEEIGTMVDALRALP